MNHANRPEHPQTENSDYDMPRSSPVPSEFPWLEHEQPSKFRVEYTIETSSSRILDLRMSDDKVIPTLYATWAILMAQYTNRDDACFGILPPTFSTSKEISTVVFHTSCRSTLLLSEFIPIVQHSLNEIFDNSATALLGRDHASPHLDGPSATIRNAIGVISNTSLPPKKDFNTHYPPPTVGIPLTLYCLLDCHRVQLISCFDRMIVGNAEISRVMEQFLETLKILLLPENQKSTLGNLDFLNPEDRSQIMRWNMHTLGDDRRCLHTLFEDSTRKHKSRCALLYREKALTYEEVDNAADNLAAQIQRNLKYSSRYIPICFEKSFEMLIAIIAVLKIGKAFVPMDPNTPKCRLDQLVSCTRAQVILVSETCQNLFDPNTKKIIVDPRALIFDKCSRDRYKTPSLGESQQPAYVLFTSGSTGDPKGVVVDHSNISTSIVELGKQFGFDGHTRMLQFTSYTFDPAMLEIFGPLTYGGCVCIPTESDRLNNIPGAIDKMKINTAVFVPSVLRLLSPEEIPTVMTLIVGGEILARDLIDRWARHTRLINAYGPTETCICSVANFHATADKVGSNIGKPVACRAWVVNPNNHLRLMPVGCVGELLIEGPTVARGYLDNRTMTDLSFITTLPWIQEGDRKHRAYRTGDLVRYLPNGNLIFLGRKDNQVKLRGHRIELSEIESHFHQLSPVQDNSVQLLHIQNSSELAAFVVLRGASHSKTDCPYSILKDMGEDILPLWKSLSANLPHYMIPKYLIPVNFIPRLVSGKVDRSRLVRVGKSEFGGLKQYQFGQNEVVGEDWGIISTELLKMRDLWAKVLEIESTSISLNDDFLHLGGNSIKAMKLVSAARVHGFSLNVGDILQNCTIQRVCDSNISILSSSSQMAFKDLQIQDTYKATWIQTVSLSYLDTFPEGNYTRLVLEIRGSVNIDHLEKAVESLVQQNDILRTIFTKLPDGSIEGTVRDSLAVPLLKLQSRSQAEAYWQSFNMAFLENPLAEFTYVVSSRSSILFSIGLQHCQYDAWTMVLLMQQLQMFYDGKIVHRTPSFLSYANHLSKEINPIVEAFWKNRLADVTVTMVGEQSLNGDSKEDNQQDGLLQQPIRLLESEFTFTTILYTAWSIVLWNYRKDQDAIVFCGAVSGRNIAMEGIMDVVGPTINLIPFSVNLAKCRTYKEALKRVREAIVSMIPYEAMPYIDIIQRCTSWEPSAVIGSIIQHLDIDFSIEALCFSQEQSSLDWRFVKFIRDYGKCRATDIYILSKSLRGGVVDIEMKFNPARVRREVAERLFQQLHSHILAGMQNLDKEIVCF